MTFKRPSGALERARPCPRPLCGGAGRLSADVDRVIFTCTRCSTQLGMQRCPGGHEVAFALSGDDARVLLEHEATIDESLALLGLDLVEAISVRNGRLGATCHVCGEWATLPVADPA